MARRHAQLAGAAAFVACAWATTALGESEAERLFKDGVKDLDNADYPSACAKLERSYELSNEKAPLRQWARCEAARGNDVLAADLYDRFLAVVTQEEARVAAERDRAEVLKRLGEITFARRPGAPADVAVFVDGSATPIAFDKPARYPAGSRAVKVVAAGKETAKSIQLDGGGRVTIVVPFDEPRGDVAQPTAPAEEASDGLWIGGWVVLGVGAAGVVGAAVTGGLFLKERDDALSHCDEETRTGCSAEAFEAADRAEALLIPNGIFWGVAIVGVGAAIPMLVIGDQQRQPAQVEAGLGALRVRVRF